MHASNTETIYFAGSGDWTQARLITVSGSARTVPMSRRNICFTPTEFRFRWVFGYICRMSEDGKNEKDRDLTESG